MPFKFNEAPRVKMAPIFICASHVGLLFAPLISHVQLFFFMRLRFSLNTSIIIIINERVVQWEKSYSHLLFGHGHVQWMQVSFAYIYFFFRQSVAASANCFFVFYFKGKIVLKTYTSKLQQRLDHKTCPQSLWMVLCMRGLPKINMKNGSAGFTSLKNNKKKPINRSPLSFS